MVSREKARRPSRTPAATRSVGSNWLRLIIGIAVVVFSAELIVRAAMTLAIQWDVDQSFIGIAIIGIGTSLPELMISLGAVLKNRVGLSVGNLLGSNVLDTLLPVGLAAVIVPLEFPRALLNFDLPVLMLLTAGVLAFFYRSAGIRWPQAMVVLAAYCGYMVTISRAI